MKVLYYGWHRENFPVLENMKTNYGWYPSIIATNESEKEKSKKLFPESHFIVVPDLRLGQCDYSKFKKIK